MTEDAPLVAKLAPTQKEEQLEAEREAVLASVAAAKLDTLQEKVAWVLNHFPQARNSDVALQIHYWEEFEPELGGGGDTAEYLQTLSSKSRDSPSPGHPCRRRENQSRRAAN